jgi:hypothetical protein
VNTGLQCLCLGHQGSLADISVLKLCFSCAIGGLFSQQHFCSDPVCS